jgi:hypothetical protein
MDLTKRNYIPLAGCFPLFVGLVLAASMKLGKTVNGRALYRLGNLVDGLAFSHRGKSVF